MFLSLLGVDASRPDPEAAVAAFFHEVSQGLLLLLLLQRSLLGGRWKLAGMTPTCPERSKPGYVGDPFC